MGFYTENTTGDVGRADSTVVPEARVSSATFYKRRAKYGSMGASMMKRFKELEGENQHLKKIYAEERLKSELCQGGL